MLTEEEQEKAQEATQQAVSALDAALSVIALQGLLEGLSAAEIAPRLRRIIAQGMPEVTAAIEADITWQLDASEASEGIQDPDPARARKAAIPCQTFALNAANKAIGDTLTDYQRILNQLTYDKNTIGYERAARKAMTAFADAGISYREYTRNGKQVRLSLQAAINRELNTSGNEARFNQTIDLARRAGENLVEVNTTANCRESHASWQGGIYMLEGSSAKYPNFYTACHWGDPVIGIGGYNCGHQFRIYRESQGRQFADPLEDTDYTLEQARQLKAQQRSYERSIRKEKCIQEAIRKTKHIDPDVKKNLLRDSRQKLTSIKAKKNVLISSHPMLLKQEPWRESIMFPKGSKSADFNKRDKAGYVASRAYSKQREMFKTVKINGKQYRISEHILNERMPGRKVDVNHIIDAIENPIAIIPGSTDRHGRTSVKYIGNNATASVNERTKRITTCWKTGERARRKYGKAKQQGNRDD